MDPSYMNAPRTDVLNKLPEITLFFWIMKILRHDARRDGRRSFVHDDECGLRG